MRSVILMYHRVCPLTDATRPWFERGMAVRPETWRAQLSWLSARFEMVSCRELHHRSHQHEALCAVTFDDGWRDVLPLWGEGIPLTLFPVVCSTLAPTQWLPVDAFYDLLVRATRRNPTLAELREAGFEVNEVRDLDEALRWWVRGPIRQQLFMRHGASRASLMRSLAHILEVDQRPPQLRYLGIEELRQALSLGHEVGGHSKTHPLLSELPQDELEEELLASCQLLQDLDAWDNPSFCYPNGDYNQNVINTLRQIGFKRACTVQEGAVEKMHEPMTLPRIFMRDVLPGEEGWPQALEIER